MAGASYAITPNTSIDLNYRYLNLGDAVSGYIPAGGGGTINYDNISAQRGPPRPALQLLLIAWIYLAVLRAAPWRRGAPFRLS